MKTFLLAAIVLLPVLARATPEAAQAQLDACAAGQCWDSSGKQVTAPPPGSVVFREPSKVRSAWDRRPAEPPRYTVIPPDEVKKMERRSAIIRSVGMVGVGAVIGTIAGGLPGALVGAALGGIAAFVVWKLSKR